MKKSVFSSLISLREQDDSAAGLFKEDDVNFNPDNYFDWQREVLEIEEDVKCGVLLWSRRAGKDFLIWHILIKRALRYPGTRHMYYFPTEDSAKKIIWDGYAYGVGPYLSFLPHSRIVRMTSKPMVVEFDNGSSIYLQGLGGAEAGESRKVTGGDSSLGLDWKTIVFTEAGTLEGLKIKYNKALPAVSLKCDGAFWFIGTPRGHNDFKFFYDMCTTNQANGNKEYFSSRVTIDQFTSPEKIEKIRIASTSEGLFQQEMYCSFNAASENAVFGEAVGRLDIDNKIKLDSNPLYVSLDLGTGATNSVWIMQYIPPLFPDEAPTYKFVYHITGFDICFTQYIQKIKDFAMYNKLKIAKVFVPHDAIMRQAIGLHTRIDAIRKAGLPVMCIDNNKIDRADKGETYSMTKRFIRNTKIVFSSFTLKGLNSLKLYTYKDPITGDLRRDSIYAHDSDAFRYMVVGLKKVGLFKYEPATAEEMLIVERKKALVEAGFAHLIPIEEAIHNKKPKSLTSYSVYN